METEFLILGAGLAGASTAYHLRRRGVTDLLVVDQAEAPGVHSSGRNAALIRVRVPDPDVSKLARRGVEILRGEDLAPFRETGSFLIGHGKDDVSRWFPPARGKGLWCPQDGVVEVAALLENYLREIDVRFGVEVLAMEARGERVVARTRDESIVARWVVNAAGAWAARFSDLPLSPTNRHLFITPPRTDIDPDWPFVWDDEHGLYFRPESGGLLLCACDEVPATPGDYREDSAVLDRLGELVATHQPGLGELSIMNQWVGQRTFAPDRKFLIGPDPHRPGVFHVSALGGHGVTCSPAIGELAASLLLDGPGARPNPFDPRRVLLTA
jgi:glycine/D-amino acid oxidase-like deaminating enzyme